MRCTSKFYYLFSISQLIFLNCIWEASKSIQGRKTISTLQVGKGHIRTFQEGGLFSLFFSFLKILYMSSSALPIYYIFWHIKDKPCHQTISRAPNALSKENDAIMYFLRNRIQRQQTSQTTGGWRMHCWFRTPQFAYKYNVSFRADTLVFQSFSSPSLIYH